MSQLSVQGGAYPADWNSSTRIPRVFPFLLYAAKAFEISIEILEDQVPQ